MIYAAIKPRPYRQTLDDSLRHVTGILGRVAGDMAARWLGCETFSASTASSSGACWWKCAGCSSWLPSLRSTLNTFMSVLRKDPLHARTCKCQARHPGTESWQQYGIGVRLAVVSQWKVRPLVVACAGRRGASIQQQHKSGPGRCGEAVCLRRGAGGEEGERHAAPHG